jgi:hypothetical protein
MTGRVGRSRSGRRGKGGAGRRGSSEEIATETVEVAMTAMKGRIIDDLEDPRDGALVPTQRRAVGSGRSGGPWRSVPQSGSVRRSLPAAFVALALTGCVTVQGGIGPLHSTTGTNGMMATAGVGVGYSWQGHQGVFLSPSAGVLYDQHARAVVIDSFDYQNFGVPFPFRISARVGPVIGRERYNLGDRVLAGGAVTWFALVHRRGNSYSAEQAKEGLQLFPTTVSWTAVGVEIAVDAHFPDTGSPERTSTLVTVSLVSEFISMLDR